MLVDAIISQLPAVEINIHVAGVVKLKPLSNHVINHLRVLHYFGNNDGAGLHGLRLGFARLVAAIVGRRIAVVAFLVQRFIDDPVATIRVAVGAILGTAIAILVAVARIISADTFPAIVGAAAAVLFATTVTIPTTTLTILGAQVAILITIA